jgi:quercetin dioxygenase-like cupin family protein
MPNELNRSIEAQTWMHEMAEISNIPGHEAGVQVIDRPPGVSASPHYHPDGHEWVYVASGCLAFHNGDQPEKLLCAGDVDYIAPNIVHHGRNPSATEPVKLVLFRVKPVGAPLLLRTQA